MTVEFGKLERPYFIFEVGINHNGDLQLAKKLIDAAFACNWDCVKFQKRNPDVCVPENQKNVMRDTPWGRMTYLEYKRRMELGDKEYHYIDNYCREKPISWTASVWDLDSLHYITQYDIPFIKIPSAMITNLKLIEEAAKTGIPVVISTGMSTIEEIDKAVNIIKKQGVEPVLMHTNSSYPTPRNELNLNLIPFLKKRYGCVIGYSGHEYDLEPTVVAAAVGAEIIERHVTMSHDLWGTDHKSSLEVHAADMLRKRIMDIKTMLGSDRKEITKSEIPIREKLKSS